MISTELATTVIICSFLVSLGAYVWFSKREGTYLNLLVPSLVVSGPACYALPWIYAQLFGVEASRYAFVYVYVTLAAETIAFVFGYALAKERIVCLPFRFAYRNFTRSSLTCLGIGLLIYVPILLEFREYLLDPRQIYAQTRTGYGTQFYISSILAYLAVILILFTKRSWVTKAAVITVATGLLLLHGSKGHVLNVILLLALFYVYGAGKRAGFFRTVIACSAIGLLVLLLFAGTMTLGDSSQEIIESISQYSDYTRNAMLVIDSHMPLQYGRLTMEANTLALVPRVLMPNKPKNFGSMRLDDEFYPDELDADAGAPAFGVGVQYADFGDFAILYVIFFSVLRGWLGRIFVNRLNFTHHPADFFMVVFLADVSLFPVGGLGWFLPGAFLMVIILRFTSAISGKTTYRERRPALPAGPDPPVFGPLNQSPNV